MWSLSNNLKGPQGDDGPTGPAPNLTIGSVTTLPAGENASVSISGSSPDYSLSFAIPQGNDGTAATGNVSSNLWAKTGYWAVNAVTASTLTTKSITLNRVYYVPFFLKKATPIDQVVYERTSVSGVPTGHVGIYNRKIDGTPGSLLYNFGSASMSGTIVPITTSYTLPAGWFYFAFLAVGGVSASVRAIPVDAQPNLGNPGSGGNIISDTIISYFYEDSQSSLPTYATTLATTGTVPAIWFRIAEDTGEGGGTGFDGADGAPGPTGPMGPAPNLYVGSVTTGAVGSNASVSISGSSPNYSLSFTIPRGNQGPAGTGVPERSNRSGRYYSYGVTAVTTVTHSLSAGTAFFVPVRFDTSVTIDRLGFWVTSATGTPIQMALYSESAGMPLTKLVQYGQVSPASSPAASVLTVSATITAGLYFFGILSTTSAQTVSAFGASNAYSHAGIGSTITASGNISMFNLTSQASLPTTVDQVSLNTQYNSTVPTLWWRIA